MEQALVGLHCTVIPSTSDEAPGLLAYGDHHRGVYHSPDLFHGQHALSKAVSGPLAVQQRAAAKAEETLTRVCEHRHPAHSEPGKRGPGRPAKVAAGCEQAQQDVEAARPEPQRCMGQREQVTQSLRAIGPAYHFVALERGVRRNGTRIAGDIQRHLDTIRTMAQQEHLSETCMERIEQAARVVPKMPATIACVSK